MKPLLVATAMWLLLIALNVAGVISWPWIAVFIVPIIFLALYLIVTGLLAEHMRIPRSKTEKVP